MRRAASFWHAQAADDDVLLVSVYLFLVSDSIAAVGWQLRCSKCSICSEACYALFVLLLLHLPAGALHAVCAHSSKPLDGLGWAGDAAQRLPAVRCFAVCAAYGRELALLRFVRRFCPSAARKVAEPRSNASMVELNT
jgi:hypothetical protein